MRRLQRGGSGPVSQRSLVNVGSAQVARFMRAGTSSTDGRGAWRSLRSSPGSGKPATWRREAASRSTRDRNGRRSLVNTGAPCTRVLGIQTTPTPMRGRLVESRVRGDARPVRRAGRGRRTACRRTAHRAHHGSGSPGIPWGTPPRVTFAVIVGTAWLGTGRIDIAARCGLIGRSRRGPGLLADCEVSSWRRPPPA